MSKTGDNQTAVVAGTVPIAPSVTVKDAAGNGVSGVPVTFEIVDGGGSVTGASATTDKAGVATVGSWKLGTLAGVNTLRARATDGTGIAVTFTATGTPGPATTITKVGSEPATGSTGGNIDSIVVRITDQFGNPVAGETVTFAVTGGGGSVSPTSRVTLADGRAAARWTLGSTVGEVNTATATRAGLASPTVTFSTTTVKPVGSIRFSAAVLVVDSSGTITPTITVFDQSGVALPGAGFTLASRNTLAATTGSTTVTGLHPGQAFIVATSSDDPAIRDSALVLVANVGFPVVRMTIPRFDLKTDTTFTVGVVVDMRASADKLGATTLEVTWDTGVLSYVSDAEGSSGVGATVNSTNAGSGRLTMAMASSAGFAGAVEIRKITFKASTVGARTGSLAVVVVDMAAATTFANLFAKTVSGTYPLRTR